MPPAQGHPEVSEPLNDAVIRVYDEAAHEHAGEFKDGEFRSRDVEVPVMFNGSP